MKIFFAVGMAVIAASAWAQQPMRQQMQQQMQQAASEQVSVGELRDYCSARDEASKNACRFFILGVAQGAGLAAGEARDRTHFCIPEDSSTDELLMVVKRAMAKDLAAFPRDLNKQAVSLVGAAMMQAYPCRRTADR